MWAWLFHMKVATRSPARTPSFVERRGQSLGALGDLEERRLLDAVGRDGEDLLVRVHALAVSNDVADQQWRVLHRALHGSPSCRCDRCYKLSGRATVHLPGEAVGLDGRGKDAGDSPVRCASIADAALRPSAIAHTMRLCPRTASPQAKTGVGPAQLRRFATARRPRAWRAA